MLLNFRFPLRPSGGEGFVDTAKGVDFGAGDETVTRYPQAADFVSNVCARQGEVGGGGGYSLNQVWVRPISETPMKPRTSRLLPSFEGVIFAL